MTMDYSRALAVAVEAAHTAGTVLREAFHRLSGVPADRSHAEVDVVAEQLIRDRLLAAFPNWGYLGEETGARPAPVPEPAPHVWLVDPHDGTRAFLEGRRGAAVSIALLRDGVPVLGAVSAYAAPDDDGDLFAWAEGQGPLRRNGEPIDRPAWPTALGRHDVVLVSDTADRAVDANLQCVAPARFRAVPSIAYRLALAAAGEAVAGSSLAGPVGWDLAGGHALLRAVGGELVDEHGRPVRYRVDGRVTTESVFGGAPAVVPVLAGRPWTEVFGRRAGPITPPPPFPLGLVAPQPGAAVADAGILCRAQGCFLGQVAGDSLGSLVEFRDPSGIAGDFPGGLRRLADGGTWATIAGQPTDDSELALVLARSIVAAGRYDPETAAQAYGWWYQSRPFDIGTTTVMAVSAMASRPPGSSAAEAGRRAARRESQANGSLMRCAPIGIWGALAPVDAVAAAARADSALTHPQPVCQEACATFAVAVARAIQTGDPPPAVYEFALEWTRRAGREPAVRRALEAAATEAPASLYHEHAGWVLVALQNAFHQLLQAPSLEDGVVATAMLGGDTDTNGAIAGALLGAVYGRDAVPFQWRSLVLSCRTAEGVAGVEHPRPRPLWPVDLLVLAERLLVLGSGQRLSSESIQSWI